MYDQAGTEKHSREDESELLCNAVAKKAIPTNGKLCRFEEIKTTCARPLHVKKQGNFLKQGQLYTFAIVYCNHTIISYNANCSYLYQSFLWPIFNQIQHTYIHIVHIVPFYQ